MEPQSISIIWLRQRPKFFWMLGYVIKQQVREVVRVREEFLAYRLQHRHYFIWELCCRRADRFY